MKLRGTFTLSAFEATAYVALSSVVGTLAFVCVLPALLVSLPLLLVALAGLPLLWLILGFCHALALAERRRAAALLGAAFPVRALPREGWLPGRMLAWMRS